MKRRDFILTAIGVSASLSKAQAQQTSAVLGVLGNGSQLAVRLNFAPAKAQLAEMGYVEARNLALEYHGADDQLDRLPLLSLLESCAFEDERYFVALIRMYDQAVKRVLDLPVAERHGYAKRLENLRSRARPIGWGIEDELNSIWYEAGLDDH